VSSEYRELKVRPLPLFSPAMLPATRPPQIQTPDQMKQAFEEAQESLAKNDPNRSCAFATYSDPL
jgi:hypothetical protein